MMQHTTLEARAAIRKGASYLFSSPDCAGTVLAAIARSAGGSPGNGYLCFGSRRAILRASNAPRLRAKSDRLLGAALATTLQPISRIARDAGCRSAAVAWREETVSVPVVDALPSAKCRQALAPGHTLSMAFHGFAMPRHRHPTRKPLHHARINAVAAMWLGS